ncbi:MAG: LPXTG cell wall anchor domain-containing protein [Propionicimonas sp.]
MATGVPTPTITWQVSTDGAVTWRAITADPAATPSEDGKTLTVVGGPANDGNLYRAIASNTAGSATSMAAELSVTAPDTGTTDDPDTGLPVTGSGSLTFALLGAALLLLAGGGVLLRIRGQNNKPDDSEA